MENASFITIEDGDDLIVSFAIPVGEPGDVKSLTLLRTPKYEFALDEFERGVTVSVDDLADDENELVRQVVVEDDVVTITSDHRTYRVSVGDVDDVEIEQCKEILKKMNYDGRFALKIV